jgi:hypothetical protein
MLCLLKVAPPVAGAALVLALTSCASLEIPRGDWRWFGPTTYGDVWTATVESWQQREGARASGAALGAVSDVAVGAQAQDASRAGKKSGDSPTLAYAFVDFHKERRRAFAREVTEWIQSQARQHFVADGDVDRWATLEEVLASNGDDCDGLALLAYHLLRDFGFAEGEIYQAIVYRAEDDQYHMVTLWFEDRDDPWVIDPTAAMVSDMVRMSEIEGWRPLKLFTESEEYTVRATRLLGVAAPPP